MRDVIGDSDVIGVSGNIGDSDIIGDSDVIVETVSDVIVNSNSVPLTALRTVCEGS